MSNFSEEAIVSAMIHLENNNNFAKLLRFDVALKEFNTDNWRTLTILQIDKLIEKNPKIKNLALEIDKVGLDTFRKMSKTEKHNVVADMEKQEQFEDITEQLKAGFAELERNKKITPTMGMQK